MANDTAGGAPNDLFRPTISTSSGFNDTFSLIQNPGNAPMLSSQALITGVDPQVGPLADDGGPTQTMLPSNASPVIDQGKAQSGLTEDQRGDARTVDNGKPEPPGGDGTDIGAVELPLIPPSPPGGGGGGGGAGGGGAGRGGAGGGGAGGSGTGGGSSTGKRPTVGAPDNHFTVVNLRIHHGGTITFRVGSRDPARSTCSKLPGTTTSRGVRSCCSQRGAGSCSRERTEPPGTRLRCACASGPTGAGDGSCTITPTG